MSPARAISEEHGRVEDLAAGSSPTSATAPPAGAVVPGVTDAPGQLGSGHRRRRQLLVEARLVHDAVLAEQVAVAGQLEVVPAKRRALVAGHVGGRRDAALAVMAGAVEQHADERLDPREVDRPVLALIALVEGGHARAED